MKKKVLVLFFSLALIGSNLAQIPKKAFEPPTIIIRLPFKFFSLSCLSIKAATGLSIYLIFSPPIVIKQRGASKATTKIRNRKSLFKKCIIKFRTGSIQMIVPYRMKLQLKELLQNKIPTLVLHLFY